MIGVIHIGPGSVRRHIGFLRPLIGKQYQKESEPLCFAS